jgi:hypothetical protein
MSKIDDVINADNEAYILAIRNGTANYAMLCIDYGCGAFNVRDGYSTAKDIWEVLPDTYKEICVPISYRGNEYIVTKDFYKALKEVIENG